MLVRWWRKQNPSILLMRIQAGTATVENSMDFPQKTKDGTGFQSSDPSGETVRILNHQFKRTYDP